MSIFSDMRVLMPELQMHHQFNSCFKCAKNSLLFDFNKGFGTCFECKSRMSCEIYLQKLIKSRFGHLGALEEQALENWMFDLDRDEDQALWLFYHRQQRQFQIFTQDESMAHQPPTWHMIGFTDNDKVMLFLRSPDSEAVFDMDQAAAIRFFDDWCKSCKETQNHGV